MRLAWHGSWSSACAAPSRTIPSSPRVIACAAIVFAQVISRSTFPGQGHHGGHWLGDNFATYQSMAYSIPGILAMNMFGISLVGADICGFNGASNEQLCSRWTELGAFYTFTRNHNAIGMPSQEPYVWPSVAAIAQKVLAAKYLVLPYYNTLFFQAWRHGGTVVRPLFFEFPMDALTWNNDAQFLVGHGLLISPVLTENATNVLAYFPPSSTNGQPERWFDFWTLAPLRGSGQLTLDAPIDHINVHMRGGVISTCGGCVA